MGPTSTLNETLLDLGQRRQHELADDLQRSGRHTLEVVAAEQVVPLWEVREVDDVDGGNAGLGERDASSAHTGRRTGSGPPGIGAMWRGSSPLGSDP